MTPIDLAVYLKFWYFGVEDKDQNILFRKDFTPQDDPLILKKILNS